MKRFWTLTGLAVAAFAAGIVMLNYIAKVLTQRGLDADAKGTSGYTTNGELAMLGGGVLLVFAAVALAVLALVTLLRSRLPSSPALHEAAS